MKTIFLTFLVSIADEILDFLIRLLEKFSIKLANQILFEGQLDRYYSTKEAIQQIIERYKGSIEEVNTALGLNISFTLFALYAYFALPSSDSLAIPLIGFSVDRKLWISISPMLSYGLQTFILTSFIWFLGLRLSLKTLPASTSNTANADEIQVRGQKLLSTLVNSPTNSPDFTNLLLKGIIGNLWMLFRIGASLRFQINYFWYYPLLLFVVLTIISPVLVCVFFVIQLVVMGSVLLGIVYAFFLVPYSLLFLLLVGLVALFGISERLSS